MAVLNDAAFKTRILSDLGVTNSPNELSDADITQYYTDCINDLNENIRNYVYRTLTPVSGTQEYSANDATKRVVDLWRNAPFGEIIGGSYSSSVDLGSVSYSFLGMMESDPGLSMFNYPSLANIWSLKLKAWKKVSVQDWDYVNGKIWLIPTPTDSENTVIYVSHETFTGAVIPSAWATMIRWFVQAEGLKKLARVRWNTGGVMGSGGQINYSPQRNLLSDAETLEKKYAIERDSRALQYSSVV